MKYCRYCGKELLDEAVICMGCGCRASASDKAMQDYETVSESKKNELLKTLSERLTINGVIWIITGVSQVLIGILLIAFFDVIWLIVVGVINIFVSADSFSSSKKIKVDCTGIVKKYTPLTGPIITLVYNLIFGGVIGVAGSIYYLFGIRAYVTENAEAFEKMERR